MTDNEIIKALEWHLNRETHCNECPYKEFKNRNDENCVGRMLTDALDLINRQQAEIERLEGEYPCKVKCGNNCEIRAKTLKHMTLCPFCGAKNGWRCEAMKFGDYVTYEYGCEEKAKEILKIRLHRFIEQICDIDEFWIKKEFNNNPLSKNTIGWKIEIANMDEGCFAEKGRMNNEKRKESYEGAEDADDKTSSELQQLACGERHVYGNGYRAPGVGKNENN